MSSIGEVMSAVKSFILIEERVRAQAEKVEKVAQYVVDLDHRLVRVETTLDIAMRYSAPPKPIISRIPSADTPPMTEDGSASVAP